jgi:1-acyl-sn-glycerol-3-phosphate acyltransferase
MKRNVFIFPEGTRSLDGKLREFKGGAFTIARKSGCRIVPVPALNPTHCFLKLNPNPYILNLDPNPEERERAQARAKEQESKRERHRVREQERGAGGARI